MGLDLLGSGLDLALICLGRAWIFLDLICLGRAWIFLNCVVYIVIYILYIYILTYII